MGDFLPPIRAETAQVIGVTSINRDRRRYDTNYSLKIYRVNLLLCLFSRNLIAKSRKRSLNVSPPWEIGESILGHGLRARALSPTLLRPLRISLRVDSMGRNESADA